MNYKVIEHKTPEAYSIYESIAGVDRVVYTYKTRAEAEDMKWLLDMVVSTWCYGGDRRSDYIMRYATGKAISKADMLKAVDKLFDYLDNNFTTRYAGTDSEGVSYNTIVKREK